jgi:subtilisin family serine protease
MAVVLALAAMGRADTAQNAAVNGTRTALMNAGFGALDGTGIVVGQNESGVPNRFNGVGNGGGTANLADGNPNLPNAQLTRVAGSNNITNHASEVAGVILSSNAADPGIAPAASIISANNSDVGSNGGGSIGSNNLQALFQNRNTPIINMSFGLNQGAGGNNGNGFLSPFVDWAAGRYDSLVVVAGNETPAGVNDLGSPSDAYNIINVGATGVRTGPGGTVLSYNRQSGYNLSNTTADGRIKTDLVAPGGDPGPSTGTPGTLAAGTLRFDNQFHTTAGGAPSGTGSDTYNGQEAGFRDNTTASAFTRPGGVATPTTIAGTSFAAPLVSGAATLLYQQFVNSPVGQGFTSDHRLMKAILLNGAQKTNVDGTALTDMNGNNWTRAAAAGGMKAAIPGSGGFTAPVQAGLDPNLGTGQLNIVASLNNYVAGKQGPGLVTPIGWDFNTVTAGTLANTITQRYDFRTGGGVFQATLAWDDPVTITANAGPNNTWQLGAAGGPPSSTFARGGLTDLDLYLFALNPNGTLGANIAFSTSIIDNVEHLYVPMLATGSYEIDVVAAAAVGADTPFGLAWSTVPEPGSWALLGLGMAILVGVRQRRRLREAGPDSLPQAA